MSLQTLERAFLKEARIVLVRKKLKMSEILEWSTGNIEPQAGEEIIHLPEMNVNIAVLRKV